MRFIRAILIATLLSSVGSASARAQMGGQEDHERTGFYLLGAAAIGFENSEDLDDINKEVDDLVDDLIAILIANGDLPGGTTGSGKIEVDVFTGFNIAAGYRLTPRVAVEGEFEWAQADIDLELDLRAPGLGSASDSTKFAEYTYWLLSANTKLFAFTGRIQPYALIGVGVMNQELEISDLPDDKETGAGFRFGGGVDLYITRQVALAVDFSYVLTAGDVKDNDVMSLDAGLLWRF